MGDFLGSLDVFLATVGCLGGFWVSHGATGTSLGAPGPISTIFWEIPGRLLASFWVHFWMCFCYFRALFLNSFLERLFIDFGISFGVLLNSFV